MEPELKRQSWDSGVRGAGEEEAASSTKTLSENWRGEIISQFILWGPHYLDKTSKHITWGEN